MNTNKTKYTAIALALTVALLAGSAIMAVGLVENTKKPADVNDKPLEELLLQDV